ncbi:riboflavin synthase [Haloarchaeobius sp. TZWWS8]|uniref:riboflavin synthase n=1 Tax=Haloarchaeobius sp. TZWWS8 TaxID=3446121 RepID=UPI003EC1317C
MYTGLVVGRGTVSAANSDSEGYLLRIETNGHVHLSPGDSVAVSGICLTAERTGNGWFEAFCTETTVEKTAVASYEAGDHVNLEPPLRLGETLDGHLVRGCVESTSELLAVDDTGTGWRFRFAIPDGFAGSLVEGGGVTLDGVSLTVASLDANSFTVSVVPKTFERTTLQHTGLGDPVNFEPDLVASYVARQQALAD